jgi:hypothetical protein
MKKVSNTAEGYIVQMSIIILAVFTALCNLTFNSGENNQLWISILSLSLGSVLPNPKYKKRYHVGWTPTLETDSSSSKVDV